MNAGKKLFTTLLAAATLPGAALAQPEYTQVTDEDLQSPAAGEWLQWRGTYDNHGDSPLDQINRETVSDLTLAWAWPMPVPGLQELAPLVRDGIMFLGHNQNWVQALDAKTRSEERRVGKEGRARRATCPVTRRRKHTG